MRTMSSQLNIGFQGLVALHGIEAGLPGVIQGASTNRLSAAC